MTVDYHKLNKVITPLAATIPNIGSLVEHMKHLVLGMQLLTWKMLFFFPPYLLIKTTRSNLLSPIKVSNTSSLSYFRGRTPLQPSGNLVNFPFQKTSHWSIILESDILLIKPSEQEVETTLGLFVRYLHIRTWEINLQKKSEVFYLSNISRDPVVWNMLRYTF